MHQSSQQCENETLSHRLPAIWVLYHTFGIFYLQITARVDLKRVKLMTWKPVCSVTYLSTNHSSSLSFAHFRCIGLQQFPREKTHWNYGEKNCRRETPLMSDGDDVVTPLPSESSRQVRWNHDSNPTHLDHPRTHTKRPADWTASLDWTATVQVRRIPPPVDEQRKHATHVTWRTSVWSSDGHAPELEVESAAIIARRCRASCPACVTATSCHNRNGREHLAWAHSISDRKSSGGQQFRTRPGPVRIDGWQSDYIKFQRKGVSQIHLDLTDFLIRPGVWNADRSLHTCSRWLTLRWAIA